MYSYWCCFLFFFSQHHLFLEGIDANDQGFCNVFYWTYQTPCCFPFSLVLSFKTNIQEKKCFYVSGTKTAGRVSEKPLVEWSATWVCKWFYAKIYFFFKKMCRHLYYMTCSCNCSVYNLKLFNRNSQTIFFLTDRNCNIKD